MLGSRKGLNCVPYPIITQKASLTRLNSVAAQLHGLMHVTPFSYPMHAHGALALKDVKAESGYVGLFQIIMCTTNSNLQGCVPPDLEIFSQEHKSIV